MLYSHKKHEASRIRCALMCIFNTFTFLLYLYMYFKMANSMFDHDLQHQGSLNKSNSNLITVEYQNPHEHDTCLFSG